MRSVYFSASEGPPRTVSISQSSVSKQQAPAERGPALSAPARPQADESEEGNLPHGCILKSRCRSDCFLPKHAALRQGTGQVGCIKGSHLKSLPSPPCLFLPLCPQVFVELAGNGSLGLQHHPNLGCSNSACFEGPQQKVPCVVPHRPSCQGSRAEHLYCTGRRRFSLQPTISEADLHVNAEYLMQLYVKRTFRCTSINGPVLLNYINCLHRFFNRNHSLFFFFFQNNK
ncbi:uncharacterized protein [Anas platyrhynchos]|uniref:uncharacterized protein isoform X1 n=1 Tax=Anas platyrhynchos TaxID=8839 RepID=UPI003AF2B99E